MMSSSPGNWNSKIARFSFFRKTKYCGLTDGNGMYSYINVAENSNPSSKEIVIDCRPIPGCLFSKETRTLNNFPSIKGCYLSNSTTVHPHVLVIDLIFRFTHSFRTTNSRNTISFVTIPKLYSTESLKFRTWLLFSLLHETVRINSNSTGNLFIDRDLFCRLYLPPDYFVF